MKEFLKDDIALYNIYFYGTRASLEKSLPFKTIGNQKKPKRREWS